MRWLQDWQKPDLVFGVSAGPFRPPEGYFQKSLFVRKGKSFKIPFPIEFAYHSLVACARLGRYFVELSLLSSYWRRFRAIVDTCGNSTPFRRITCHLPSLLLATMHDQPHKSQIRSLRLCNTAVRRAEHLHIWHSVALKYPEVVNH